jgi:hypothetical protein
MGRPSLLLAFLAAEGRIEATSAYQEGVTRHACRLPHPTHRFSLVSWDPVFILSQIEAI